MIRVTLIALMGVMLLFTGCEKEHDPLAGLTPSEARPTGKREYGEIKAVVLPLPEGVIEALGGADVNGAPLKDAHIYFRSMTLVVFQDAFDVKDYVDRMAEAFSLLATAPDFGDEADSWAIQMQNRSSHQFVTLSCSKEEAVKYSKNTDINRLLKGCDYFMINDVIVSNQEKRIEYYEGAIEPPELAPTQ